MALLATCVSCFCRRVSFLASSTLAFHSISMFSSRVAVSPNFWDSFSCSSCEVRDER